MIKNPETYEELIRFKKCVDLTKYYELSQDEIDKIFNFLSSYQWANIVGNKTGLVLEEIDQSVPKEIINANCIDKSID
jgi:hypothetical protein